jgi:hypothetical protein
MTKRTDSELWAALDEATLDAELEAASELTPDEVEQDLIEAGYNIDELHAQADAFFASLPARIAVSASTPRRRRSYAIPVGLALAASVALTIRFATPPPPVGSPPRDAPAAERAAAFRHDARDACNAHRWATCLDKLNDARTLDPAGDEAPDIEALRKTASAPPPANP